MKTLKALLFCFCALAIVSCSDDDTGTTPDPSTTDNSFQSKTNDHSEYNTYRLDENGAELATTASYSSRTVLHTNMTFEGKSNVVMAVDTVFVKAGSTDVERVDTVYYMVDNNSFYIYNFAETFAQLIPTSATIQVFPVNGWIKVAELKESASTFSTSLKVMISLFGGTPTEQTITMNVQNKGKQTVAGAQQNYMAFRQEITATTTLGVWNITIPITLDIGGVKAASNSPSTMINMIIGKFTNPIDASVVTGRKETLAAFTAGS